MNKYWATSKDIEKTSLNRRGFYLEYNPNIKMYRINRKGNMPKDLMGYSPHKEALITKALR